MMRMRPCPTGLLGAAVAVPDLPGVRVVVARMLDDRFEKQLKDETREDVRLSTHELARHGGTSRCRAAFAALADGQFDARLVKKLDVYAASVPVLTATGEGVALIEVRLPTSVVENSVGRFLRRLALIALFVGVLAVLAGVCLAGAWRGPCARSRVRDALGQGDSRRRFGRGQREVQALARTMENMRRNLVELTTELRQREAEAQALLAGVVEGVFAVDTARVVRYVNPQAARMLGVERARRSAASAATYCAPSGPTASAPARPIAPSSARGRTVRGARRKCWSAPTERAAPS